MLVILNSNMKWVATWHSLSIFDWLELCIFSGKYKSYSILYDIDFITQGEKVGCVFCYLRVRHWIWQEMSPRASEIHILQSRFQNMQLMLGLWQKNIKSNSMVITQSVSLLLCTLHWLLHKQDSKYKLLCLVKVPISVSEFINTILETRQFLFTA